MKEKIKELRLQGLGYKVIAKELDTHRKTVRWHCKQMGLDGVMGQITEKKKRFCVTCGEEIQKGLNKYCSKECRIGMKKSPQTVVSYCVRCGKEFESKGKAKHCSNECRKKPRYDKSCLYCGQSFVTTKQEQTFCTHKCYNQHKSKTNP